MLADGVAWGVTVAILLLGIGMAVSGGNAITSDVTCAGHPMAADDACDVGSALFHRRDVQVYHARGLAPDAHLVLPSGHHLSSAAAMHSHSRNLGIGGIVVGVVLVAVAGRGVWNLETRRRRDRRSYQRRRQ